MNKLDNLTVNENESASYTIKFSGKPVPKVKWFKNDIEVEINEKIELIETVENQFTLTIKSCDSTESIGSYYAKVSNEFGEVVSNKATLTVNSKDQF